MAMSSAAAPSLTPDALPAVTVPPLRTRRQLGQRLERRVGARMFVGGNDDRIALRRGIEMGRSLWRAAIACAHGAQLGAQRERVLIGARHAECSATFSAVSGIESTP